MARFAGKVAVVTGGSVGIGRATAVAFAREGAAVVVASRRAEESEKTVQMVKDVGGEGFFVKTDVTQAAQIETMVEKTMAVFGRLDFAFNNAGVEQQPSPLPEQSEELFDWITDINYKGTWLCMKYQIPQILKSGGGAIVNMSSIAGEIGFPGVPIYTASKHAVLGLTKAVALEYAKSNIRVNAVSPGAIHTDMYERFEPEVRETLINLHPLGRPGKPEEVAQTVLFLCSEGAGYITGHSLMIDGGYVAQ
ncbi:MAG: SDR family oxidoreductase [Aphanocapsa lilacina HA4352-LM1]|jgi:NAD(P)-dependent dehydrogenase (short-subunit alcohol dehydrogenase family)|nr:SDR family oxidoreductase [Aphanocapsa lilacina HA4352-LM1]